MEKPLWNSKNPAYLTGISRTVYQNILDFLPAGQAVQIFNQGVLISENDGIFDFDHFRNEPGRIVSI